MVAPSSALEQLVLKASSDMASKDAAILDCKKKQLLAANKQKARELLLGIYSSSYVTASKTDR